MSFNLSTQPTTDDIRVGYVDPDLGYVFSITICEANDYAKDNPGTTFIFVDGNNVVRYLSINEVNGLTPQDLLSDGGECGGPQVYKECGPPVIQIFGGGGIGAAANPIIGRDGSLLAVDLVRGGHGYQFPPLVAAKDYCQFGSGAVLTSILGETPERVEVYEGEEDFELYELCDDTDVGYGELFNQNGIASGQWEPGKYTKISSDPIQREIEAFQNALKKPYWTTRSKQPRLIYTKEDNKVYHSGYHITDPRWSQFMNNYAISPIAPSGFIGTDEASKTFVMEWEEYFPITGEYIFRGHCDNIATLFIDDQRVFKLNSGVVLGDGTKDPIVPNSKTIQEGSHTIKIELVNAPTLVDEVVPVSTTTGGGTTEVNFNISVTGKYANSFEIPELGISLSKKFNGNAKNKRVKKTVEKGKVYKVKFDTSRQGSIKLRKRGDSTVQAEDDKDFNWKDIECTVSKGKFFDLQGSRCKFVVGEPAVTQTSQVNTGRKLVSPNSFNNNPMGASVTIEAPQPTTPQENPPIQTGRCPPNPIWSTRFPGSSQKWYPVRYSHIRSGAWSKFMDRYAISPILPLNTEGSDKSGITYTNSWQINIPYRGYYGVKGTVDNRGRILIDGREIAPLDGFNVSNPKLTKVLLEKGNHTIVVEVFNKPAVTKNYVDTKIFSTQDWRKPVPPPQETAAPVEQSEEWVQVDDVFVPPLDRAYSFAQGSRQAQRGQRGGIISKNPKNASFHRYNEGTWYKGKRIRSGGDWNDTNVNKNYIQWDDNTRLTLGSYHPAKGQRFGIAVWQKKKKAAPALPQPTSSSPVSIVKGGVTYEGPELVGYESRYWSKFMNEYSITPKVFNSTSAREDAIIGKFTMSWKNVNFPQTGLYKFNFQGDNIALLKIGGVEIYKTTDFAGQKVQYTFNLTAGKYDIVLELENVIDPVNQERNFIFDTNPMGVGLYISRDIESTSTDKTPWTLNPVGVSAILIPPPCARKVSGRGVVDRIIINDPGNGYLPAQESPSDTPIGTPYTVLPVLTEVIVEDPGINYNCGVDEIRITPDNGAVLTYDCDPFGKIRSVSVVTPAPYDVYPQIDIISETGVNAVLRPVITPIRDPIDIQDATQDAERLIQVTDLVGLKQTGYVDGRAYYGAIYFDEGVPYAGFYKTTGTQVRVYATLEESITAQVTTPPSAIQRSGTDISSNDPRLNIPGTPDSTI